MKIKILLSALLLTFISLSVNIQTVFATAISNGMNASYVIGTSSGTQDFTVATAATTAIGISSPGSMVIDYTGNRLFVGDAGNHRVLSYNLNATTKQLIDYTADNVLGQADFTSGTANRGGSAAANTLSGPTGVAVDGTNLYVVDKANNRVLVFDITAITDGENAVNVLGQADFTTVSANRGGSAAANTLSNPGALDYDSVNDFLYVSDNNNNRVLKYNLTAITDGENAVSVLGQADFTSSSANRGGSAAQNSLKIPAGLDLDETTSLLYVSDGSGPTANGRVMVFDVTAITDGENAAYVLAKPDFTTTTAALTQAGASASISGLSVDADSDRLFVQDSLYNRTLVYDITAITNGENAAYVLGQPDFTTSTAATTQAGMSSPGRSFYDSTSDFLYVGDSMNHRVLVYDLSVATADTGKGYTHPPQCTAQFTPSTITLGESSKLSWTIQWPTEKMSSYYTKVPNLGVYGSKTTEVTLTPDSTKTYQLSTMNLYGASFCDAKITVLDTDGTEIVNAQDSYLTANSIKSPFGSMIVDFFKRLFGKK